MRQTAPHSAPNYSSTLENNMNWLETYENNGYYFRMTIFYKRLL